MTASADIQHASAESLARIRALAQLAPEVLGVALDDDWTGSALLARVAFRDRRWA